MRKAQRSRFRLVLILGLLNMWNWSQFFILCGIDLVILWSCDLVNTTVLVRFLLLLTFNRSLVIQQWPHTWPQSQIFSRFTPLFYISALRFRSPAPLDNIWWRFSILCLILLLISSHDNKLWFLTNLFSLTKSMNVKLMPGCKWV